MGNVIDAAIVLRNHLSHTVLGAVRDGDIGAAIDLVNEPVWKFLGKIIGDVSPPDTPQPPEVTE